MKRFKYILSSVMVLASAGWSAAQTTSEQTGFYDKYQLEIVLGVGALVCFVAVLALLVALYTLRTFVALEKPKATTEPSVSFWKRFLTTVNDAVPIEQEATIMTSHEYDGIKELDNRLPPWWLYGFYLTIIFSVGYILHYHVFKSGDLQTAEYQREMAEAQEQVDTYLASLDNRIDESSVTFASDEADLIAGEEIYTSNCLVCHGANGEGVVGPNFTDKYWIHGGDIVSIFKTIKYGVPEKGMIAWQAQLSPKQMQQVSSFIYTLEGTNPPNPKEPQGELFEREEMPKESEVDEGV